MSFEQLNKAADTYYATRSQDAFRALYSEAQRVFQTQNRRRVCASGYGDRNDADSILDDVILKLIGKDALNGFGLWMATALKNARIDWLRKEQTRGKRYELTINKDDEDAPTSEIADELTTEDIVIQRYKKKEADQRQLIDFLSRSAKTDTTTTTIVTAYLFAPLDAKPTEIARSLGIHHETVKRKLRRLARRYDANRFGDVHEYLAV
ncbi:hypothetical protein [Paenibacillus sp. B-A-8]|uniref:hypothetical protein n=1 Tax=Paenibacillus sp. B-A-8 TaxID=3400419 RepID=UPI003B027A37